MAEPDKEIPPALYLPPDLPLTTYYRAPPPSQEIQIDPGLLKEMSAHISWQTVKQELGQVIVRFQLLETSIKKAISLLVDKDDFVIGEIVTNRMDFARMLGLLFTLFSRRFPSDDGIAELEEILKACDQCRVNRNTIVHSFWYPDDDGSGLRVRIPRSKIGKPFDMPEPDPVSPESLRADADKCMECWQRLDKFFESRFPDQAKSS